MKVLLIVTGFPTESNPSRGRFNLTAAQTLSVKNEVTILKVCAFNSDRLKLYTRKYVRGFDLIEYRVPIFPGRLNHSNIINKIRRLYLSVTSNLFKKESFDIIHAVGGGLSAQVAYEISRKVKTSFIIQYVGSDLNFYLDKYRTRKYVKDTINNASFHVFNSLKLEACFNRLFGNKENLTTIYRGVDLEKFYYQFRVNKKRKILFLGGFTSDDYNRYPYDLKGGVTLLKALNKLDVSKEYRAMFCGPATNSRDVIKDIRRTQEIPDTIEMKGEVNQDTVLSLLHQSHIVVIPSYFEGLPNVLLEAMASGNCVIASEVGGIPELIKDGENGYLFKAGAINELTTILKSAIENEHIEVIARNARRTIEKYSHKNFGLKYSMLYKKVIS